MQNPDTILSQNFTIFYFNQFEFKGYFVGYLTIVLFFCSVQFQSEK